MLVEMAPAGAVNNLVSCYLSSCFISFKLLAAQDGPDAGITYAYVYVHLALGTRV